jgi:hypothetical protein
MGFDWVAWWLLAGAAHRATATAFVFITYLHRAGE